TAIPPNNNRPAKPLSSHFELHGCACVAADPLISMSPPPASGCCLVYLVCLVRSSSETSQRNQRNQLAQFTFPCTNWLTSSSRSSPDSVSRMISPGLSGSPPPPGFR